MALGIEQIKKDLVFLAKITKKVDEALEDGKFTTAEGIGVAFSLVDLIGVIKNIKTAKEELYDLKPEEVTDIAEVFKKEFDLRDDKAEEIVETIIELALNVAISMGAFKEEVAE